MVLNFLSKSKKYTADDMLERAKEKAYLKNVGWLHEKLIAIANYEGFFGKKVIRLKDRNDLSLDEIKIGMKERYLEIVSCIKTGIPVIVSVKKKNSGHMIVITGIKTSESTNKEENQIEKLYVCDPDDKESQTSNPYNEIDFKEFSKIFRGSLIMIKH